jgi:hypothetical protein
MKTVHILEPFTGYPNGKSKRDFAKGEEPELSNEYADLVIAKGHAREAVAETKEKRT